MKLFLSISIFIICLFSVAAVFASSQVQADVSLGVSALSDSPYMIPLFSAITSPTSGIVATSVTHDSLAALRTIPQASRFVTLLEQSGVASEISSTGTYTFFVPTNDAFVSSPFWPVGNLSGADQKRLAEYHIVSGQTMSLTLVKSGHFTMLSGDKLDDNIFGTDSVVEANVRVVGTYQARNGVIYLVDHVLMPPARRPFPF